MNNEDIQHCGEILSVHHSQDPYGGTFGEIRAIPSGKVYIYSGRNFFRNGSVPEVGGQVMFRVVHWSYATDINRVDKRM
jgi:hypothetical protein